ncbi:hypothetical protein KGM_203124 [Danaus plexippus plexippus]|uniref:Uncharacterized protein n=1 Tax=Danaus plexippus plexippus TaxID=278856 RepID=A0A212FHM4_DANPL|nr:hypothetical protein KGM_203124 [Danaus plexippus plexippus]
MELTVDFACIVRSAGGSSGVVEDASDGSDAERRRHLRVPTPTHLGHEHRGLVAGQDISMITVQVRFRRVYPRP